jgi:hypothetical protein
VVFAIAMLRFGSQIRVDPTNRVGQVSAMAQLQLALAVLAIGLITALVLAERFGAPRDVLARIGCAAVAGLASGLVAGGIAAALRDTPYGLWADEGDYAWILQWVAKIINGQPVPNYYPPLFLHALAEWSRLTGEPAVYAIKDFQLIGTALFGPAVYLAWRLVLRPGWALGIGLVAAFPLLEPVKPYTQVTLVLLVPVLIAFLRRARCSDRSGPGRAVWIGAWFGAGFGVLFLLYSGWFVWCAPGVLAAFAIVVPWRRAAGRALILAGSALAAFLAVAWVHLSGILAGSGGTSDTFFYFDTNTDPAYFAMWRNDVPGDINPSLWPPPAEWAGVGLFTIALAVGLAVALGLGWRRTPVITVGLVAVSAWVLRMYLAGESYATQTVRLYPRTTAVLLYCMLLLAGFAVQYAVTALRARSRPTGWSVARIPAGLVLIPLLLLFAAGGSNWVDRLMPGKPGSFGGYATLAHNTNELNGTCPHYATTCKPR